MTILVLYPLGWILTAFSLLKICRNLFCVFLCWCLHIKFRTLWYTSLLVVGFFIYFLSFFFFLAIYSATSAISHVVLGQFKTCVVLLGNYYLFGSNPGMISICGAFTAIVGMSFYAYLNLKQQSSKIYPRQASTLPKPKLGKANGSSHDDGRYSAESVWQNSWHCITWHDMTY